MGCLNLSCLRTGCLKLSHQTEINKTVLPQNEMFNRVINTVNSLLNIAVKIMEFFISTVVHGAEKLAWTI